MRMMEWLSNKYLEHQRSAEIRDTAAAFPTSSCRAINVTRLEPVGSYERRKVMSAAGQEWTLGHLKWPQCDAAPQADFRGGSPSQPIAVLLTLDRNYLSAVPRWSRLVQQVTSMRCVIGTFDPQPERVCRAARDARCECEVSTFRSHGRAGDSSWSLNAPRRVGVRARFQIARRLLPRFHGGVLMHDADVAFDSLEPFHTYLRWARRKGLDLIVQPNGPRRREAFEDLNFGLTWFASNAFVTSLLSCLLDSWEHPALIDTHLDPPDLGGSYRERSQPRLTHLLEDVQLRAPHRHGTGSPRLCALPREMRRHYAHATVGNGSSGDSAAAKLHRLDAIAHELDWRTPPTTRIP